MKILVIGPAWVGDMMMSHVLLQLLRHQHPKAEIHVLAPAWSEALLSRMPEVTKSIVLPFAHGEFGLLKRYRFAKVLRAEKYDCAYVLPNSWKSALIPFFARIPERIGFLGESRFGLLNKIYRLDKARLPKMIERFAALAYPKKALLAANLPTPYLTIHQENVDITLKKHHLIKNQKVLVLCPGAEFGPSKCWPPEYYAAVANEKIKEGWAVWILGSQKDAFAASLIQSQSQDKCVDLTGKTSLAEAVDLLSIADVVVTNDSGLMHVACALNRRVIALYGSTSTAFTPPLGEQATVLQLQLDCQPCFARTCPLKHHRCMRDLLPEQVFNAISSCDQNSND